MSEMFFSGQGVYYSKYQKIQSMNRENIQNYTLFIRSAP